MSTPDGRVYQVYDYPFADVDGSPLVLEMGVDITARKKAEEARGRLIEILEATPDFVGIADYHGKLQYLNRAGRAMVGIGADEDIAKLKVLDLHPQEIHQLIMEVGAPTAVREGVWQAAGLTLRHRDGREIPVSQVILAHKDQTGRVQFFSTVARDISDIKEAQASILRHTAIVNGINRIFKEALVSRTEEELGQTCLTVAEELTASPFGFIDKVDEKGNFMVLAASSPDGDQGGLAPEAGFTHLGYINSVDLLRQPVQEGVPLLMNAPASPPELATPQGQPPLTAFLGVPLTYRAKPLGLIGLANKTGGFTPTDQETVQNLAPAMVEALMHRRAEEALKASESKLRYLADQLLTAQENERKRLASELHDELGHALLALKLHLSAVERKMLPEQEDLKKELRSQLDYINEVIQEVRRLYHDLSPGDVEDLGLTKALVALVNDFAGHFPQTEWQVDLGDLEGVFSLPVQTIIYRLIQEALTNIGKHANCTVVTISSRKEHDRVRLTVQDNGVGFNLDSLNSRAGRGVGLVAMEERLNMIGGSFAIESREQQGTTLSFTIPTLPEGEKP